MSKNLCILKKIIKNNNKMPLFPKKCTFWGFTYEMERETDKEDFCNKVIFLNVTSVLIFQYRNARKTSVKLILYNWSISNTTEANLKRKSLICSPRKSKMLC